MNSSSKNRNVCIGIVCPYNNDSNFIKEHGEHLAKNGDIVKDIAFSVEN